MKLDPQIPCAATKDLRFLNFQKSTQMSEVLTGYKLKPAPYPCNPFTHVSFYQGTDCSGLRVVVKQQDFPALTLEGVREQAEKVMTAGLEQAAVQNPHVCQIFQVRLVVTGQSCSVFHVLEQMETNVGQDIEERKKSNRPYTEAELWAFLQQVSKALAYAHSRGVAHRDIKPSNVFRTKETYKVGDFGEYWRMKRDPTTSTLKGDDRYFSPQMREAHLSGGKYDAMKNDVFALGATWLEMAAFVTPNTCISLEETIRKLPYSQKLKDALLLMLAAEESQRCTMNTVNSMPQLDAVQQKKKKAKQREIERVEALRVLQEQAAKTARAEEMKRAGQMQGGVCRAPAAGAKCTKRKTINCAKVFQAKRKQKSSLVAPKDLKVLQNQAQTEAEGQKKEQQLAGYRQRAEPIQEEVKPSPQIFPQFGICRRCEVICKGCGKVASSTQSYCVHCNTVLKEKLSKQCGQQQAPSVSSLCKDCASRPAVSQFMKKGKAMPKHLLIRR